MVEHLQTLPGSEQVLPLRLTPFEEYFWVDHRPSLPMTENLIWFFRGRINRTLFEQAFEKAVENEPFLSAIVRKRRGRYYWTRPSKPLEIEWEWTEISEPVLAARAGSVSLDSFDLTRELPVRFRIVVGSDGFLLHTALHHALADGLGFIFFIERLFSLYAEELRFRTTSLRLGDDSSRCSSTSSSEFASIPSPDPRLLRERENFHPEYPESVSLWASVRYTISETFLWFCRRPLSLTPIFRRLRKRRRIAETNPASDSSFPPTPTGRTEPKNDRPKLCWQFLPEDWNESYRQEAKKRNVSVNSLWVRDLFVALARWREKIGEKKRSSRRFRFMFPVNLRNRFHQRSPLANMIGYVFLDRFPDQCDESEAFLTEIESQMREIKKWSVGLFFLDGLRFFRRFSGALRFLTARWFCHSTLVFSNLGVIGRNFRDPAFRDAGTISIPNEATLLQVASAPPVRSNTPIAIALISNQKKAALTFCVDSNIVADGDRDELIAIILDQLRRTAARPS